MLPAIAFSYNTGVSKAIKHAPFHLMHTFKARMPPFDPEGLTALFYGDDFAVDLVKRIEETRQRAIDENMLFRDAYETSFNKDRTDQTFRPNDKVLIHHPQMAARDDKISKLAWLTPVYRNEHFWGSD